MMSAWEKWSFNVLTIVVSASGLAYLYLKHFVVNDDPFAVVNHPLQPVMLAAHILTAPLLVLLMGMLLQSHVMKKLANGGGNGNGSQHRNGPGNGYGRARGSGLIALVAFAVMALSGYGLQVVSAPPLARIALIAHLAASVVFIACYLLHLAGSLLLVRASLKGRPEATAT